MSVLTLVARDVVLDRVVELDADGYLIKPFGLDELFARIQAHSHPAGRPPGATYRS